ncbi:MAG: DUF5717 family protein [Lachnospiraceae bacterium]|nr:DUF5717 family protein [Lachnospiraceae bacterium]
MRGTGALEEQDEVCRLALLDHYARSAALTKTQRVYAAEMLEEFNTKGMRFAFFGRFDRELRKPLQLQGHVFAEYVGNPKSTVYILYRRRESSEASADVPASESDGIDIGAENGIAISVDTETDISAESGTDSGKPTDVPAEAEDGFTKELVPNCFEGIFVKEFVLFAGEEMECGFPEIPPLKDGEKEKSEIRSEMWVLKAESQEREAGMYGLLNRLCGAVRDGDEAMTQEILDAWLTYEYLSEEVFTLV